ncbi:glutamyl aminopeptidase-like [Stylophora pistillata]|uniref:glutamyl aminopeptidase-like n=1 Tax=Stylophora pistillata TaxID=50429 RepID=UPI000C03A6A5|nr:glutamyl aminopeptidase-like [Stylophora pistillata]
MEQQPLKEEKGSSPLSPGFKKTGLTKDSSRIINKRTVVVCCVLIFVLLILVIVLGALLGAERRKNKDTGKTIPIGDKPSPTIPHGGTYGPTTAGTEEWWNVRLPDFITPVHYDVMLYIDLKKLEFYGDVEILLNVEKVTEVILVHVNLMNVTSASVVEVSNEESLEIRDKFKFDKNQFYVLIMKSPLKKGEYKVKLEFKAWLRDDLAGLYKSTYKRKGGREVTIAATQFQPTDARRTFPCLDEPALKATFNVTLVHHPDYISISNMPIEKTVTRNEWQFDRFQKTPKMPTYLLAFVVCDFANRTVTSKGGTKMTFYAPPDQIDQVEYAKNVGVKMLDYMEEYFSINYPLPKADMIAIPDFAAGAMENWGLITYRETALLYDPVASSESNKMRIASVVSHELAHQWFGNLVTMEWWDDLWLNEGFASFVEYYGVNATEPDWKVLDQFVVADLVYAFSLDGLANSHPIKVPVNHPDEINEIFDSISYNKGASIIRMLQYFLGRNVFLKGLTNYLRKYEYRNAVTDDLWKALAEESCTQGKCVSVKQMMDTWTLQMGYPVLNIKKQSSNKYQVSQERFLYDRNSNISSKYTSPFNYKWVVPFTYNTKTSAVTVSKPLNMTSADISWDGSGWIKGNVGQTGFYRVNYEQAQWDALTTQMDDDYRKFDVRDRAGLMDDAFNLARGGYIKYTTPLNLTKYLADEDEYVPWRAAKYNLGFISSIVPKSSSAYKYLEKYLHHQVLKQYQKLGFSDTGDHLEKYKRSLALDIMCGAGEPSCLKNASNYFKKWKEDPVGNSVPANFRSLVYFYGIKNSGVEEWDFAFEQFQNTTVASERRKILYGLAGASEPWILSRYLQYSITPDKIKSQDTSRVLSYVANYNPNGRQLTWQFLKLNWNLIKEKFGGGFFAIRNIILSVTSGFSTEFELEDLKEFNRKHSAGSGTRAQQQAEEGVMANIQWRKENEQDVSNWLKYFLEKNNIPLN